MMPLVLPKALEEIICSRKVSISEQEGLRSWHWLGAVCLLLPSEVAADMVFLWKIVALFLPWWINGACPEEKDWQGHKEEQVEVCDGHGRTHSWTQTLGGKCISVWHRAGQRWASEQSEHGCDRHEQARDACFWNRTLTKAGAGRIYFGSDVSRHSKEGIFGNVYDWDRTQWAILFGTWARQTRHSKGINWGQQRLWGQKEGVLGDKKIPSRGISGEEPPSEQGDHPVPCHLLESWKKSSTSTGCLHQQTECWVKRTPGAVMHKQQFRTWPSLGGMAVFRVTAPGA